MTFRGRPSDDAEDDGVGYRKPPRTTRFAKGRSGNPAGRPRGRHRAYESSSNPGSSKPRWPRLPHTLSPADQRIIVEATRTPHKVRWPKWWSEHP